jgi:glycosyltransferase involved in cell wall biosynthesis
MEKYKILMLSDHALSPSGVGVQSRFLANGLVDKGRWTVRQLGAAIKHDDYSLTKVAEDFLIKPVDGFGTPEMIRSLLASEKPDIILLFTDPRFFVWLWQIEDEIHQICPIAYWHVWDNKPYPDFNDMFYKSTDLINCHSHHTYTQVKERWPERTNFIPHSLPSEVFYRLDPMATKQHKVKLLGENKANDFVLFWVNRNAKRKRPADILESWSKFLNKIDNVAERKPATLIMHTDPYDQEGPDLTEVAKMFGIVENVIFSTERVGFQEMNILHNVADCSINISYAEGFGLGTLESLQVGTPIIAIKTGGLTRQVVDHRDESQNGIALEVELSSLVGSQNVPYIYEDYVSTDTVSDAILKMYTMPSAEKAKLSKKCEDYAKSEFNHQKTIDDWDSTLAKTVENWKEGKSTTTRFELIEI